MPPNRFESEVESFLEGSHGDRTHIKRADHPRLHHYAGRYCVESGEGGTGDAHGREKVRPAGVDSGPNREKIRPAGENRPILRCFVCAGRTFSRVGADGGEQGEFCRACGVWIGLG